MSNSVSLKFFSKLLISKAKTPYKQYLADFSFSVLSMYDDILFFSYFGNLSGLSMIKSNAFKMLKSWLISVWYNLWWFVSFKIRLTVLHLQSINWKLNDVERNYSKITTYKCTYVIYSDNREFKLIKVFQN